MSFLDSILAPRGEHSCDLGGGLYFTYNEVSNGLGGYVNVGLTLRRQGDPGFAARITDREGTFVHFPGAEEGSWRKDLTMSFTPRCRFRCWIYREEDGTLSFEWMVQPDGRYWGDDDGFGMDHDVEVTLFAPMDENGKFTGPFAPRKKRK